MKRGNRMRRVALVLALLMLTAMITGVVAASGTKPTIPERLTGKWDRFNWGGGMMVVGRRGKVNVTNGGNTPHRYHAKFSQVKRSSLPRYVRVHRLIISGPRSCSGTGTYGWTIYQGRPMTNMQGWRLRLTKIHDACKARVNLFAHNNWGADLGDVLSTDAPSKPG
jgi:hypothetical protein